MNPYLPCDRQDVGNERPLTNEQEDRVLLAEQAGLIFGGFDDDGDIMFLGTDECWDNYEKLLGE